MGAAFLGFDLQGRLGVETAPDLAQVLAPLSDLWQAARTARDFARADHIRAAAQDLGIGVSVAADKTVSATLTAQISQPAAEFKADVAALMERFK